MLKNIILRMVRFSATCYQLLLQNVNEYNNKDLQIRIQPESSYWLLDMLDIVLE